MVVLSVCGVLLSAVAWLFKPVGCSDVFCESPRHLRTSQQGFHRHQSAQLVGQLG